MHGFTFIAVVCGKSGISLAAVGCGESGISLAAIGCGESDVSLLAIGCGEWFSSMDVFGDASGESGISTIISSCGGDKDNLSLVALDFGWLNITVILLLRSLSSSSEKTGVWVKDRVAASGPNFCT